MHDPQNLATTGDLVRIEECRPISKTKRWQLAAVLTERDVAEIAPESIGANLVDEMQRTAARVVAETGDEASGAAATTAVAEAVEIVADEPMAEAMSAPTVDLVEPAVEPAAEQAETGDEGERDE